MRTLVMLALFTAASARAHFVLDAPLSAWSQNPTGDPQKQPPCGNDGAAVPSNAVTTVVAGETLTIRLRETIFHPGHYRVAIGVNGPGDLPAPAAVVPGTTACGSTTIQNPPVFPVLADGALLHTRAVTAAQTIDVRVPDTLRCTRCTLQVIQFMSDHALNVPGGCYYHHCATLTVVGPDAGIPLAGDAGVDAGISALVDGGTDHVHEPVPPVGCGCTESTGLLGLVAVLVLGLLRRQYR